MQLAVSSDMLLEGRHFSPQDSPAGIGHKSLAVNLSDLAAMGATPRWATLAIALPEENDAWLTAFARGFFRMADLHGIELVGGDTTRGALTLSITVMGEVPPGQALRRDGAQAGDDIWVSGVLGSAALALAYRQGRLFMEQIDAARVLPALVSADTAGGAGHRAARHRTQRNRYFGWPAGRSRPYSGTLAAWAPRLEFSALPTLPVVQSYLHETVARDCVLAGGDDYELCFTAPADRRDAVHAAAAGADVTVTRIGQITAEAGLFVIAADGKPLPYDKTGYDHFAA